jgi:RNA polymerase primary sigma factor
MNLKNYSCKYFGGNENLKSYLNSIRRLKVMTAEEEAEMFKRIAKGDDNAREQVVTRNQRFVYSVAKLYSADEDEVLDLVNEGNIGLMEAIDRFDPSLGFKFITFAVNYIRRSMNSYRTNDRNMIVQSNSAKIGKKADKVRQRFFAEHGHSPSNEQVVELLKEQYDLDIKNVVDIYTVNVASINEEIDDDYTLEKNSEFNSKTASANTYETETNDAYNRALINRILATIPAKQADIIRMAYGIDYPRVYSIAEIGEKYNMDEETTIQVKNNILLYLHQNRHDYKLAI